MTKSNFLCFHHGSSFHQGTLPNTRLHQHGAMVLLVSLGNEFQLETASGSTVSCKSAIVDAGFRHCLISNQEPMIANYLEGYHPLTKCLRDYYLKEEPIADNFLGNFAIKRSLNLNIRNQLWSELFSKAMSRETGPIDQRIMNTVAEMQSMQIALPFQDESDPSYLENGHLNYFAEKNRLSASRFSHLFREQMGISFKRYRLWQKVAVLLRQVSGPHSLTDLALCHGFFDSSHLTNTFQNLFGLSPSQIVKPLGSIHSAEKT